MTQLSAFISLLVFVSVAHADTALPIAVTKALAQAHVPASAASFLVRKVEGDTAPLLSHRATVPMNPASVMKLVTTFSALDLLGPNFKWQTSFYTDGKLSQGVLNGNLIIRGGGDPKWVLERIEENMGTLQKLGVKHITGDIVLDNSVFDIPPRNSADFDGEPYNPYNTVPDGLLVNFKAMQLSFTPDTASQTVQIKSDIALADVKVDSTIPMNNAACGDWKSALRPNFSNPNHISFAGTFSTRCGEKSWAVAYSDPASFATRAVKAMYLAAGGVLDGQVRMGKRPGGTDLLFHAPSLPLSQIIADVNKFSNNVMAQQVFLSLSAQKNHDNPQNTGKGTFAKSRDIVKRWWQRHFGKKSSPETETTQTVMSAEISTPVLDNGSGLSRSERVSAQSLSELLRAAAAHPSAAVFAQSLSVAGIDGTTAKMANRGIVNAAVGNAQLKTGTLRDVVSIAGYATAKSGQRYSVVGIINHPNAPAARPALDALVEWTVAEN